jgi:hypothetical protein
VTGFELGDTVPLPAELIALTENVYAVAFVSPPMVVLVTGGSPLTVFELPVMFPVDAVTV